MARDINGLLASGEELSEDDVRYAVDRGITLPEEYSEHVASYQQELQAGGKPPSPVFQTGVVGFGPSAGPGIFLSEDALNELKKKEIARLGEVLGYDLDMDMKKEDMVMALVGAEAPAPPEVTPEMHAEAQPHDQSDTEEPSSEGS